MGGMALIAGAQLGLGVMQGRMAQKGYELEAEQAGLDAKAEELNRRDALQDALAMQAVITGASGRAAGEGSPQIVAKEDMRRSAEDIAMLRAGGRAKQASLLSAGSTAKFSSIASGLLQAGLTGYQASQVK